MTPENDEWRLELSPINSTALNQAEEFAAADAGPWTRLKQLLVREKQSLGSIFSHSPQNSIAQGENHFFTLTDLMLPGRAVAYAETYRDYDDLHNLGNVVDALPPRGGQDWRNVTAAILHQQWSEMATSLPPLTDELDDDGEGGEGGETPPTVDNEDPEARAFAVEVQQQILWVLNTLASSYLSDRRYADTNKAVDLAIAFSDVGQAGEVFRFSLVGVAIANRANQANEAYLDGDIEAAESIFVEVATWADPENLLPGTFIESLPEFFQNVEAAVVQHLVLISSDGTLDETAPEGFSPTAVGALRDIAGRLSVIQLGTSDDSPIPLAPVWRFEYLFQLATFFSQQAQAAERRFLEFEERKESEQISHQQIEDAVKVANQEVSLAGSRIREAQEAVEVARRRNRLARERESATREEMREYLFQSAEAIMYQAMSASLGGGSDGVFANIQHHIDNMRRSGETRGPRGYLIGTDTYLAGMAMREVERTRMQNANDMARRERQVVEAQYNAELVRQRSAGLLRDGAQARLEGATRLRDIYAGQALNEEAYEALGSIMTALSKSYFDMAYEVAKLAQSAFNYEFRTDIDVLSQPSRPKLNSGLLESEVLLGQLAALKLDEVVLADATESIVEWIVEPASLAPAQVFNSQNVNGREYHFTLDPEELNALYPGLVDVRVLELEIDQKLAQAQTWELTNGSVGRVRTDDPDEIVQRVQNVTTIVGDKGKTDARLVQRGLRGEMSRQRRPFEGTSPFCGLRFRFVPTGLEEYPKVTFKFQLRGRFSKRVRDSIISNQMIEKRLLPLNIDQLKSNAVQELNEGGTTDLDVGFKLQLDDGQVANLFPDKPGTWPDVKEVHAIAGFNNPEIDPAEVEVELKLPFTRSDLPRRKLSEFGGVKWDGDEVPDVQPGVGKYQLSVHGAHTRDISGVTLVIGYHQRSGDFIFNRITGHILQDDTAVVIMFERDLSVGQWNALLNSESIHSFQVTADDSINRIKLEWAPDLPSLSLEVAQQIEFHNETTGQSIVS
ncbi:MAG: hypothetical protein JAZ02_05760 [Candidatus Thiodiazotropha endolucinida]|nr:hypothetical protein [Candidatus Thiodiazotropha endolucinida]